MLPQVNHPLRRARWNRHLLLAGALVAGVVACTGAEADVRTNDPEPAQQEITTPSVGVAPQESAVLELDTERVVVFKDGYALFVKKARGIADANGLVYTDDVPDAAVLGSFWATSDRGVVSMRAEHVEVRAESSKQRTATTVVDLLRANTGKQVKLRLRDVDAPLEATIVSVLDEPADTAAVPVAEPGAGMDVELAPRGGQLVLLNTRDGQLALPVSDVHSVMGATLTTTVQRTEVRAEKRKRLVFELDAASPGDAVELTILYFRPGVRWIPTYRLDDGKTSGELSLQAEILNEAEDIDDAEIDLVVGVPNFRFKEVVSPLVLETALRQTLHHAAPSVMGQGNVMSNALYTQRAGEWDGGATLSASSGTGPQASTQGEGHADLFVYHAGSMAMSNGSRATLPLWTDEIARHDVYTLEMTPSLAANTGYAASSHGSSAGSPLRLAENSVWHQIELINDADVPWTTGAMMILDGALPLAQELLTYTPPGARVRVPVTVAVDVRGGWTVEETARKPNALRVNTYDYTQVTSRGTVHLTNHRAVKTTVEVALELPGRAHDASDDGKVVQQPTFDAANPRSSVSWSVELAPGESREVEVEVDWYTR